MEYQLVHSITWKLTEDLSSDLEIKIKNILDNALAGMDSILYDYEIYSDEVTIKFLDQKDLLYWPRSTQEYTKLKHSLIKQITQLFQ